MTLRLNSNDDKNRNEFAHAKEIDQEGFLCGVTFKTKEG